MPSTSSSSLTNDVPKPPNREQPATRPPYTPTLGGQAPHSHQFPRTRKMFDKGPEQVRTWNLLQLRRCSQLNTFLYLCDPNSLNPTSFFCSAFVQGAEDGDEPVGHRNYVSLSLQTGLCDWSAKYFAQPVTKVPLSLFTCAFSFMWSCIWFWIKLLYFCMINRVGWRSYSQTADEANAPKKKKTTTKI